MRWALVERGYSVPVSKSIEDAVRTSIRESDGVVTVFFSTKSVDRRIIEITNECMYGSTSSAVNSRLRAVE